MYRIQIALVLVPSILVIGGCRTLSGSSSPILSAIAADQIAALPPIACANGDAVAFGLAKPDFPPNIQWAKYPGPVSPNLIIAESTGAARIRLDTCLHSDATHIDLGRILFQESPSSDINVVDVNMINPTGLNSAVFNLAEDLDIKIPLGNETLWLKGWGNSVPIDAFAAIARLKLAADGTQSLAFPSITGGRLATGDPFKSGPCAIGESLQSTTFALGTVQFAADFCLREDGAGDAFGSYRILKLVVDDQSPSLPVDEHHVSLATDDMLQAHLTYKWNHHNACDSFALKLTHVEYAATAAANQGCGPTVPDAPSQNPSDQHMIFRIRYQDGNWQDGTATCAHFLSDCGPKN